MLQIKLEKKAAIVSGEILRQTAEFTLQEIVSRVRRDDVGISDCYVRNKINKMCELGLLGRARERYYVK